MYLLDQVYSPAKSYLQALKDTGQKQEIPFTFDLIRKFSNGNTIFVGYRPNPVRDETTPVAILRDLDNDGWIDEFKDEKGWHKAAKRADWIIYNQITPEAFAKLEDFGKSQMAFGWFTIGKDVTETQHLSFIHLTPLTGCLRRSRN